jgi:hypothetical protein
MNVRNGKLVEIRPECAVCMGLHDQAIHDATVEIRLWFRREIARRTDSVPYELEAIALR